MYYCGQHAHSTQEAADNCERERIAAKRVQYVVDGHRCRTLRAWFHAGRERQHPCAAMTAARHHARKYGDAVVMMPDDSACVFTRKGNDRVSQQTVPAAGVAWMSQYGEKTLPLRRHAQTQGWPR
jgi:hypothetical protein